MPTLVITEKPNVAERIANSLGKAARRKHGEISYFEVGDYVVAPAVGHIYGLREKDSSGWTYPVFEIEWVPSHLTSKSSDFTKKYLDALKALAKGCDGFVNACDYDVEGEVIGYNVIKYACKTDPHAENVRRVRYSTLTKESIVQAFSKIGPIDANLAFAGLTRHVLDWYWGINLSRALTNAAKSGRTYKTLSIGRVQGPTLKMLADKERSIKAFKSEKYWEVEMLCRKGQDFSAWYEAGKYVFSIGNGQDMASLEAGFKALGLTQEGETVTDVSKDTSDETQEQWVVTAGKSQWILVREEDEGDDLLKVKRVGGEDELTFWVKPDAKDPTKLNIYSGELSSPEEAQKVKDKCGPKASVIEVGSKKYRQPPPFPFDLTTLQTEAYRHFGIDPRRTLEIAQDLYTNAYISYPRTSSQQIPEAIDSRKILSALMQQDHYGKLCALLLKKGKLVPAAGKKTDPAHPAIHPTGEMPSKLDEYHTKIYDLIVRRFLAAFGEDAVRQTVTVRLDDNGESFVAKGNNTVEKGWHVYYGPYAKFEENELPQLKKGEVVDVRDILVHEKETQPPKRYTPASIIREMEKRNLGTKATRSQIVDILFKRGYLTGKSIEVTLLGLKVVDALDHFCPHVLSESLTRKFEEEMDKINEGKLKSEQVIQEGREALTEILREIKANEANIGKALGESIADSRRIQNTVGKCPKCGKDLIIRSSKMWQFVGCSGYPDCNHTWPLPRDPIEKGKECRECGFSTLTIKPKAKGRRRYTLCVNQECPTRNQGKPMDEIGKCPKCGSPLFMRTSRYGTQFIGCSGYPKCKNLWPLPRDQFEKTGMCGLCGYPKIQVTPKSGEKYEKCINPDCENNGKK